jgi:hypothetical protein
MELSQRTTGPAFPVRVSSPLVDPKHTEEPPETKPAAGAGFTVTVADAEVRLPQPPEVTALNCVVSVSAPEV